MQRGVLVRSKFHDNPPDGYVGDVSLFYWQGAAMFITPLKSYQRPFLMFMRVHRPSMRRVKNLCPDQSELVLSAARM
jgi:hypothetical protein